VIGLNEGSKCSPVPGLCGESGLRSAPRSASGLGGHLTARGGPAGL